MKLTKGLLRFSQNAKSIVGLSLIFLFLGLGSCPFKKARLVLQEDSFKKEQTLKEFGLVNKFFPPGKGADEKIYLQLVSPESAKPNSHTQLNFQFAEIFFSPEIFCLEKHGKFLLGQESSFIYPDAVPLYLKNKSLLI